VNKWKTPVFILFLINYFFVGGDNLLFISVRGRDNFWIILFFKKVFPRYSQLFNNLSTICNLKS